MHTGRHKPTGNLCAKDLAASARSVGAKPFSDTAITSITSTSSTITTKEKETTTTTTAAAPNPPKTETIHESNK